ncbi:hypothetical protein SNF32_11390 [Enterococcus mundtii]|nr:hypothetical protein [Enterococcus mundtii]
MKVRILLASIMLLNASLSPCIALAETVTNNNQQTETTSSSITEEKTTNVISPTTISTTNEEIPPPSTDTPTIIGTPQLIGESYKDGVSKPKRINVSATETMQQTFIEDEENKKQHTATLVETQSMKSIPQMCKSLTPELLIHPRSS